MRLSDCAAVDLSKARTADCLSTLGAIVFSDFSQVLSPVFYLSRLSQSSHCSVVFIKHDCCTILMNVLCNDSDKRCKQVIQIFLKIKMMKINAIIRKNEELDQCHSDDLLYHHSNSTFYTVYREIFALLNFANFAFLFQFVKIYFAKF